MLAVPLSSHDVGDGEAESLGRRRRRGQHLVFLRHRLHHVVVLVVVTVQHVHHLVGLESVGRGRRERRGGRGDGRRHRDGVVGVLRLVHGQRARLAESLAARLALEGLLLAVDVLVVAEVVLPPEGLAADVAGEGPLVRVRPLVDQQVVALGELPLAVLADVPLLGSAEAAPGSQQQPVEGQLARAQRSPRQLSQWAAPLQQPRHPRVHPQGRR